MTLTNKILWRMNLKLSNVYPKPPIRFMKRYFNNKEVVGAEIGVYSGENAENMLETLNIKKLYLIDCYKNGDIYEIKTIKNAEKKAQERLKGWGDRIEFIKKKSEFAINDIPTLDFIYIDADYNNIEQDIKNYWNKIKPRGVMSGYNFFSGRKETIDAVIRFCVENKLKLFVDDRTWWVIK